jgi:Predicted integral membrane protein (DUF2189)
MAYSHILVGASTTPARPVILRLTGPDLFRALARGYDDFSAMPSHAVFLCVIYPLLGLILIAPLAAGFALLGPLAAIGLYELSRRREAGLDCSAAHALDVLHSRSLAAIMALGLLLMAIFLIWLAVAEAIYVANFGYAAPASIRQFAGEVFTTPAGWKLIIVGTSVGFLVAVLTLIISVIAARPRRRRGGRAAHLDPRGRREPRNHGFVGLDRHRTAGDRIGAVFSRPHGGVSGARPRDVASLSQGGRTGPRSPTQTISRDRRTTGPLRISPPCSSRRGGRRCRLRLVNLRLFGKQIVRIDRYRSPIRFASGQSSDLGILNCSKILFAAN